jgi:hypothetical protein
VSRGPDEQRHAVEDAREAEMWTIAGLTTWLGWVIPMLAAEWWLDRDLRVTSRSDRHIAA